MGNAFAAPPRSQEFTAEFRRIEAAIAVEEAKLELERDADLLRQLHLQLIDMKIACTKYGRKEAHELAESHERAVRYSCCSHIRLECQRCHTWRLAQEAFYGRLLVLLEEEKIALQQRCPAMEIPLPAMEAVPDALPDKRPPCTDCIIYSELTKMEPFPSAPGTPSAGLRAGRQPGTGTGTGISSGVAQQVCMVDGQAGRHSRLAGNSKASAGTSSGAGAGSHVPKAAVSPPLSGVCGKPVSSPPLAIFVKAHVLL
ncbi:hypothetical protein D9Q98_004589 [Chlorella vulgaris]|uniref:Uncharacterized protein n=1 Tax=Chlorella vulgaris TaxID=3077 RepID=A0A9D4TPX8_CHLVU|nr:hypothetical protein D9Q98_004589 [Chlorella vulgaris]